VEQQGKILTDEVEKLQQKLKELELGSPAFERTQAEVAEKKMEWEQFRTKGQKKFIAIEAEIYRVVYQDISQRVQRYADARGIRLVIRAQVEGDFPKDPKEVVTFLQRQIIYQNGLDISDDIIRLINAEPVEPK